MKIALVILHADAARGGAERYTLDLASSLTTRGHEVSILASSFQVGETAGRRVLLAMTGMTRTGRYLSFLDSLGDELKRGDYDIVHAMLPVRQCDIYHPHAGIAVEAISAGHLNKSGLIRQAMAWVGNRFNARRRKFADIERNLLVGSQSPVVLCLSNLIRAVVSRHYPELPEQKLVELFNGIDLARFDPSSRPEAWQQVRNQFHIPEASVVGLMLAQDFERKGLAQAIKAMAKIQDRRLILLVGGKPDPSKYRQLARSLGVADRVIFAGPVSDPVAFYRAADFFILPTMFDPCSLVVLEALAMGLPVISTTKNGACEIIQDGVHGRVLKDPNDISALADAINGMLDAHGRKNMSYLCQNLRGCLSQDTHLAHLEAVYQELFQQRTDAYGDLARH